MTNARQRMTYADGQRAEAERTGTEHPAQNAGILSGSAQLWKTPYCAENGPSDPELAAVVEAWPTLPEAIKAGILAIVRCAE